MVKHKITYAGAACNRTGTFDALLILTKILTSSPLMFCAVTFFLSFRSGLSGRRRSVSFNKLVPNILWQK